MRIRGAAAADVPAVAAIEEALFGPDAWSAASVEEELTGARRHAVVACADDGAVVGYAVTLRTDEVLDLQRIAVVPEHRRSGVARRLLGVVRDQGREAGAHRLLLEVGATNEGALGFYAAEGFVQIDRRPRYYRDDTDALVLRAPLGAATCGGSRS